MEKRTKKMLLAILMIITVLAADFLVLGTGIITYASELRKETNNVNVEFSVYFKDAENRVDSIEKSIKAEDVKLYAEIKVKNEGYLKEGTVIEVENSNFNLKNEVLPSNKYINSIEGNKVNLKQINNGDTVEIELGIEPIIAEKITTDFLSKTSTVKMIGSYVYSKNEEGQNIITERVISVNYQPEETTEAELTANVITNKILSVNGENKRVIQLLIKSRLTNNEYPIKETKLTATIPQLSEETPEISAIAINELATNGKTEIDNLVTKNGLAEITLNNETSWTKNVYDELVITYIYPEIVDANKIEITTNSEITLYDSKETVLKAESKEISENEEVNNTIIGKIENKTKELYKGNLYANLDLTYNTETKIAITNADIVKDVVVQEKDDVFGIAEKEILANTKYVTTEINLGEMLEILGQEGSIEIKNGETSYVINKETEIDENGNVKINYINSTSKLEIKTSNPEKAGIIKLKHTKTMTGKNYKREQLQEVQNLKTKLSIEGISKTTEIGVLELKETTSKAELIIENNKTTLSTTEANDITLGITLVTDGMQYDLYKNPKVSIKFPSAVKNVESIAEANKQNADEFTVNIGTFDTINKTMLIELKGEQTTYPESELTQSYIQLNLKVTLDDLALGQADKIMMAYTNENATQYENEINGVGVTEQVVQISAPSQLIKKFELSSNDNISFTETILQNIKENEVGKTIDFGISLINNKESDLNNLKILGKLPTTENTVQGYETNTLEMTLKDITAENATIYYTENSNATEDVENAQNGWTQELSTLTNAKLYLMEIQTLERGANFTAKVSMQIPSTITENAISYTQYGVVYDTETETNVKESSRKIGLATSEIASLNTQITAQVGQDILKDGDIVKEGEVIKYTVTVSNNGTSNLENVQLKLGVPEGTTYVMPMLEKVNEDGEVIQDNYLFCDGYYEKITDSQEIEKLTNITISQLKTTEPYIVSYEVMVNKGSEGGEKTNKVKVVFKDNEIESAEIKHIIQEADISVTVEPLANGLMPIHSGMLGKYVVNIENISESTINDIETQIVVDNFELQENIIINEEISNNEKITYDKGKVTISEIKANEMISFKFQGKVDEDEKEVNAFIIAKDSNGKTYRSNYINQRLPKLDMKISMSSSQNQKTIMTGDAVEYEIVAKNLGELSGEAKIKSEIPGFLQVKSVSLNGKVIKQSFNESERESYWKKISNEIEEEVMLDVGQTVQMKIIAEVQYIPEIYDGNVITSKATIKCFDIFTDMSETITHILKGTQDSNTDNTISGLAWYDENGNGRRDETEDVLSNINVKLYDIATKSYTLNEEGIQIQTITDNNGEYAIDKVKNGSYLLIFEYDTEKYEPTKLTTEGLDSSLNSKAILKYIKENDEKKIVTVIKIDNLTSDLFNMNIGLKDNTGESVPEDLPEEPTEKPENPKEPIKPDTPLQPTDKKIISGFAWLDSNEDGIKDKEEICLTGIKVRLYDISSKDYLKDESENIVEVQTDANGKYEFANIEKGQYIIIFEYNTEEYKVISKNSNIVSRKIKINGQEVTVAVTDTINVQNNISNINIGLRENLKFDLELNKYISKIVVQTNKQTKTYDYEGKTLGKVEIHRKQIQGTNVVLEYTIKVKNTGEIVGYAKNIVDYLPNSLTFSSELNKDWYLSGENLYTKSFENHPINPGEEKEIKLILTKTITNENVGLINNRAEIYQDYNQYGDPDIDSIPNNQVQNEDDFGTTDVIIQVATGGSIIGYIILAIINIVLIYVAITIMIKNGIIEIKTKGERR